MGKKLCETCVDYGECQRIERVRLSGCRHHRKDESKRFTADEVTEIAQRVERPAPVYEIINSKAPMEITEKDLLDGCVQRDFYLRFLETDFHDPARAKEFFFKTAAPLLSSSSMLTWFTLRRADLSGAENDFDFTDSRYDGMRQDYEAMRTDLQEIVERWKNDSENFGIKNIPLRLQGRDDYVAKIYRYALRKAVVPGL